jgi:hypothetical protein
MIEELFQNSLCMEVSFVPTARKILFLLGYQYFTRQGRVSNYIKSAEHNHIFYAISTTW